MADETVVAAAPAVKTVAKKAAKKPSKPKAAATHPKVKDMVKEAIAANKDRKGSSLPTIKKYLAANYKVDVTKLSTFIRKALVSGTESGAFVRVGGKGKGASGSFKLGEKAKKTSADKPKKVVSKVKKPAAKKAKAATGAKKSPAKKPKVPKAKKPAAAKKPKSPAKKAKSPAKKPAAKKAKTPKKAAAKK